MQFLKVDTLDQARERLYKAIEKTFVKTEEAALKDAVGRTLAEDIYCPEMIPDFRRSIVDGYAVKAKDTQGAGESIPVFLDIAEEISIGKPAEHTVLSGECSYVPTGAMVPDGADAMVMVEYTELFDETSAAIYCAAAPGQYIVQVGEDAKEGTLLIRKGTVLDAKAIGVLASIGKHKVSVYCPWKISIISTGDELVEPGKPKKTCEIYDVNTYAVYAMAEEHGMNVANTFTVKDEDYLIEKTLRKAMLDSDIVAISGGSSQGKKDMTAALIDKVASPGVWTHGLSLKPGKPTIVGMDEESDTLFIGLPGHPVAAMMVFELLIVWAKEKLYGEKEKLPVPAVMDSNIPGAPGKTTCQTVKLLHKEDGYHAVPVFGKSGLMSTMTQADGYVMIGMNHEGIKTGEVVYVHLF